MKTHIQALLVLNVASDQQVSKLVDKIDSRVWDQVLYDLMKLLDPSFEASLLKQKELRLKIYKHLIQINLTNDIRKSDLDDVRQERFERLILQITNTIMKRSDLDETLEDHEMRISRYKERELQLLDKIACLEENLLQ